MIKNIFLNYDFGDLFYHNLTHSFITKRHNIWQHFYRNAQCLMQLSGLNLIKLLGAYLGA